MPKSQMDEDSYTISETGNWNVADIFSKIKIMKILDQVDDLERVATNGYDSFLESMLNYSVPVDTLRLDGLRWLMDELIMLCKNVKFAMKRAGTKAKLSKLEDNLQAIKTKMYPLTFSVKINEATQTKTVRIKEEVFQLVLKKVSEIKSLINEPLNENHLIYVDKEEFDPQAFKEKIKKRMIEKG